ncbi:MAG: DNA polymerase/3'-5' exonuclease PolX [Anaerolineaceae bacterium]|nr:DNA polymerase/3'-5' exonuclease PolX [Anaerolineaceae bacterium]
MDNTELAEIFDRIASLLEIKGEIPFKTLAYRRAAESLRNLGEDIHQFQSHSPLSTIPGVGKAIAQKIEELLNTGQLAFLHRLEEEIPPSLLEILDISDVGPKKAALFWQTAGIANVDDLEEAAREGRLRDLSGIGIKTEAHLLEGIRTYRHSKRRVPLRIAHKLVEPWLKWLKEQPNVSQVQIAGSMRRWKSHIDELHVVFACENSKPVIESLSTRKGIRRVLAQGVHRAAFELEDGLRLQVWSQPQERFGSLLQFATGSNMHNVRLREFAQHAGFSLSERGLLGRDGVEYLCAGENEVYEKLGLPCIPPELREDHGEIQAAAANALPDLIRFEDLTADLHMHTSRSDGEDSMEEMALAARAAGRRLIAITDHSFILKMGKKLLFDLLEEQRAEMVQLGNKFGDQLTLLHGVEVDILSDGTLDLPDEMLQKLDIVVASLHFDLKQPRHVITQRLVRAIRNPYVDIIGHPSGRFLPDFEGADLDWETVFSAARECNVALEINANPSHLDLDERQARRAAHRGVLLSINTDSHAPRQLGREQGVAVARRAWIESRQVINAWSLQEILSWLKTRKNK